MYTHAYSTLEETFYGVYLDPKSASNNGPKPKGNDFTHFRGSSTNPTCAPVSPVGTHGDRFCVLADDEPPIRRHAERRPSAAQVPNRALMQVLFPSSLGACFMACLHVQLLSNSQYFPFLELDPQLLHSAEKDRAFVQNLPHHLCDSVGSVYRMPQDHLLEVVVVSKMKKILMTALFYNVLGFKRVKDQIYERLTAERLYLLCIQMFFCIQMPRVFGKVQTKDGERISLSGSSWPWGSLSLRTIRHGAGPPVHPPTHNKVRINLDEAFFGLYLFGGEWCRAGERSQDQALSLPPHREH